MASASTSTSTTVNSSGYDVFLSHRGPDTKRTFTSHLYRRLVLHGIRVFWDKEELEVANTLTSQLQEAIKTASIHVAIFSPGYADSEWCLNELVLMVESRAPIIPVFYNVQPTDLRHTQDKDKGKYAESLRILKTKKGHGSEPRYNSTSIENWRNALSTVAGISGLELDKFNGDEGELLDKVVESVSKKLNKPRFDVADYPIGLDERIHDFETSVISQHQSGKPQVIGIVGLGGIGKTTLVQEIFNRKSSDYHRSCFLCDVRENARKSSLESMQRKLLRGLTRMDLQIESVSEGRELLKTRVSSCLVCEQEKEHTQMLKNSVDDSEGREMLGNRASYCALVILDDVDHVNQLDALLTPIRNVLPSTSLILITSRDTDVLRMSKVEESSIYKLTGLSQQHSQELFCMHAFAQRHPPPRFKNLVYKFLRACNRLPLSLRVFGGLLYGIDDRSFWEHQLERLDQILPEDIQKSLQISYDALQEDEQRIFLDIACFFIGKSKDTAIKVWEGSGWEGSLGLRSLQNKNLVDLEYMEDDFSGLQADVINMHDHLRDLGRYLANDPKLPRRIWRKEDFDDFMEQSHGASEVRGISMGWTKYEDPNEDFDDFMGQSYVSGQSLHPNEDFDDFMGQSYVPTEMEEISMSGREYSINLRNRNEVSCFDFVSKISVSCFDFVSKISQSVQSNSKNPSFSNCKIRNLQLLDIVDGDVLKTILSVVDSTNLIWLRWHNCTHSSLPLWIPTMKLRVLEVKGNNLTTLWKEESQAPLQLRKLQIYSSALRSLPGSFGKLKNLQHLNLSSLGSLETLPEYLGNLTNLQYVDLPHCRALKRLPSSFEKLTNLQHINLSDSSLETLPESLGNVTNLQHIDLSHCRALKRLPNSFKKLTNLQHINLSNTSLVRLPDSFERLTKLEYLDLTGCPDLTMPTQTIKSILCEVTNFKHSDGRVHSDMDSNDGGSDLDSNDEGSHRPAQPCCNIL